MVFDHATSLDAQGTLARLLNSLEVLERGEGKVVIIAVANNPEIVGPVRNRVEEILAPYRSRYDVACVDASTLASIAQKAAAKGVSHEALDFLSLNRRLTRSAMPGEDLQE